MNTRHHAVCFLGDNLGELSVVSERKAQEILCNSEPSCGVCNSCVKAQNKTHPDIIRVRELMPEGKYKVGDLREIAATAAVRPNDGEFKVYIFAEADTMRPECQNTLLKFTEEPPDYVRIIFTAKSSDMLLETIKSRLVFVNAGGGVRGAPPEDTELQEIAREFVAALSKKNEYAAVTALSRVKTRDEIGRVLDLISAEMSKTLQKEVAARKLLADCADDLKYNPNIALFCTFITAQICEKLK